MLIRRSVTNLPDGKQILTAQHFWLDPWETADCLAAICRKAGVSEDSAKLNAWNGCPMNKWTGKLVPVLQHLRDGYLYFRREVDEERRKQWEQNQHFRVHAADW